MAGIISSLFASTAGCTQVRKPAVAGAFYPGTKKELTAQITGFLNQADREKIPPELKGRIIGLMVPHAGYVFSGQVAATAFKQLEGLHFDTVVIIGMSHHAYFEGISVYAQGYFETPLGLVEIDSEMADALIKSHPNIKSIPEVQEQEHSLEVQIPFLQTVLDKFKIVPILMSNPLDYKILANSLLSLYRDKNVLFVASSDMTHYPSYEIANSVDKDTLRLIENLDLEGLIKWTNTQHKDCATVLCGSGAVLTLVRLTKELGGTQSYVLKYANSGDTPIGDKIRVVGYGAVAFIGEASSTLTENSNMILSEQSKNKLLEIARNTMEGYIRDKRVPDIKIENTELQKPLGVFVTLKKHEQLRGCIGYIKPVAPLGEAVSRMAISASTQDPRFQPVSADELKDIEIEITVLSELTRVTDINKIEVGIHGLYIVKGYYSGLLLPQVPVEQGWDREQFLVHTCYKAGLPAYAWKENDTEIYAFSGVIFHEN